MDLAALTVEKMVEKMQALMLKGVIVQEEMMVEMMLVLTWAMMALILGLVNQDLIPDLLIHKAH